MGHSSKTKQSAEQALEQTFNERCHRMGVAYHEAGHAVIAHFMLVPRSHVTIRRRGKSLGGQFIYSGGVKKYNLACTLLAGVVAEETLLNGESAPGLGHKNDLAAFRALKFVMPLQMVKSDMRRMLEEPSVWCCVEAVAEALLKKITLTSAQVDRIIHKQLRGR